MHRANAPVAREVVMINRLGLLLAVPIIFGIAYLSSQHSSAAETNTATPSGKPEAFLDLASAEGVQAVKGQWRYSDTRIVEVDFKGPGTDNQPSGPPVKTYDYTPHAGGSDFDDSHWEAIDPCTLSKRRGNGRLSFNWYRIKLTIPS